MWGVVVAACTHVASSLVGYALQACSSAHAVWDLGHEVFDAVHGLDPVVDLFTAVIPVAILCDLPRRCRPFVCREALHTFTILTVMRSFTTLFTVLPLLGGAPPFGVLSLVTGVGRDYIFSGRAAFVASWVYAARAVAPDDTHNTHASLAGALHAIAMLMARMHYTIDIVIAWALAFFLRPASHPVVLSLVYPDEGEARADIYRARHEVYAEELGQYPCNPNKLLKDYTDSSNVYVVATRGGILQGFMAVTPPGRRKAMQKHGVNPVHPDSYEVRLLTVLAGCRGHSVGRALMHAACRYVQASGGRRVEAMARAELLPTYMARGMVPVTDDVVQVGEVDYVHIQGSICELHCVLPDELVWSLPFPVDAVAACNHGGVGQDTLTPTGINADVLDAWFPPAPQVVEAVTRFAACDMATTPPSSAGELLHALEMTRQLDPATVLLGAGSSDLIYRCFWTWLTPASRVLLLHPTYTEYEHVLNAIGCSVTKLSLSIADGYRLTPDMIPPTAEYDLVVLTNPNSPTGVLAEMMGVLATVGLKTRVWVDETYIEYAGIDESVEPCVDEYPNLIVCKSMSKAYALSGLRVGYVCAHPTQLESVRARTPPWIVSRVAQRAAIEALKRPTYYAERYEETRVLRNQLSAFLSQHGWFVLGDSCANFVLCQPPLGVLASDVVDACATLKLAIRLVDSLTLRIAVQDAETQSRMMDVLESVTDGLKRKRTSPDDGM